MNLEQHAFKELCLLICPGGPEGAERCQRTIEAGPPVAASATVKEQLTMAHRKGILINVIRQEWFRSARQTALVEKRYPELNKWATINFPGNPNFGKE